MVTISISHKIFQVHISNGGKCGVCGDSYTAPIKENEAGGKYALGIITRLIWYSDKNQTQTIVNVRQLKNCFYGILDASSEL